MKKFICLLLAVLMCASFAFAECKCDIPASVSIAAFKLATIDLEITEEEMNAISAIAINRNNDCICSESKLAMLHVIYRNSNVIQLYFSEEMIELMFEYIANCNCCNEEMTVIVTPAQTQHVHRGGNHDNNGTCVVCGGKYQKHGRGNYVLLNNDKHQQVCSYEDCDYVYETGVHLTGGILAYESNGTARYRCKLCNGLVWKYVSSKNSCCDCCTHNCCEGCACGCDFD